MSYARDQFVADATCPADRVTVAHDPKPAPPDVAADPGRLALWSSEAESSPIYTARGCGQQRSYACDPQGDWPYSYQCISANLSDRISNLQKQLGL